MARTLFSLIKMLINIKVNPLLGRLYSQSVIVRKEEKKKKFQNLIKKSIKDS
jgi:hypothetical protein